MKEHKQTVTIGVSALNEEKSIVVLITALLNQNRDLFELDKILIISDGSTDNTEVLVKSLKNPKVQLIADGMRRGKPNRMNEIFAKSRSDVVVILDADIYLKSQNVINDLVEPFIQNKNTALTSGLECYLQPNNFIQKVVGTGIDIWNDTKAKTKNTEMYLCEGKIRAFSRSLYSQMTFPNVSADDVYPYLLCKILGFEFVFVPRAKVYYTLPATLRDYVKQHARFLLSESIQENNFSRELVKKYYSIGIWDKVKILTIYLVTNPFWTLLYMGLLTLPKVITKVKPTGKSGAWDQANSTKS